MLAVAEYASHEPTPASPLGSAAWAIAVSSPEETYDFTVLSTGPVTPTYQFQSVHRDDPKPTQHFADRVETPLVSFAFMEETCGVAYYVDDGTPWFSCDPGGELGFPEDVRDARTGYMSRQIRLP